MKTRVLTFDSGLLCPACGGKSTSRFLLLKRLPALLFPVDNHAIRSIPRRNLVIRNCDGCCHQYAVGNPRRFLRKIYEVLYHYYPMHAEGLFDQSYRSPMREALIRTLEDFADQKLRVLEVGANEPTSLSDFEDLGHTVFGVSPDAPADDGRFFRSSLEDMVVDKKFDLVVSRFVLEHIAEPATHLAKIRALLKPGGALVLQVPNCEQFRSAGVTWYFAHEHRQYFTPVSLQVLLQRNGFDFRLISGEGQQSIISASRLHSKRQPTGSWENGVFGQDSDCERLVFYGAGLPLLEWVYGSDGALPNNVSVQLVDDNPSTHGRILPHSGLVVQDPSTIPDTNKTVVVISTNPFYYPAIKERISRIAPQARVIEMS